MKRLKKLSIFITIFVLLLGAQFTQPKKAYAFLGIGDVSIDLPQLLKEYGIDTLVTILQNRILNKLIDDSINWANGGFDGDPGFLDNWDDFLEGTEHDVLSNTFYTASKIADEAASQYQEGGSAYNNCRNDENNIRRAQEAGTAAYDTCYQRDDCALFDNTDDDSCDSACWGEGLDAQEAKLNSICGGRSGSYQNLANTAAQNYRAYMNGDLVTKRGIATTVANFGARELNFDPVDSLINGEGNTLAYLLGSQAAVDTFGADITKGGWKAYIALSDPHNYPSGVNSLVAGALGSKADKTVDTAVQSMQTPQKYQDKRKCVEWSKNNTNKKGEKLQKVCLKYETQTPGSLIEGKVKKALTKDEDQSYLARELSDVLARALGRLTDGLLQAGLNAISKKHHKNGEKTLQEKIDETFSSAYQNAYDVLGIADDARLFNQEHNNGGGSTGGSGDIENLLNNDLLNEQIGNDASTPYVGGPEDMQNSENWSNGPELVIELKGNLEKSYNLTKETIKNKLEVKTIKNNLLDIIPKLDKCLPGPDFGWEDRFQERTQNLITDVEEDYGSCDAIRDDFQNVLSGGDFSRTKQIAYDRKLNIPGAQNIRGALNSILSGSSNYSFLQDSSIKEKNDLLALLGSMMGEARDIEGFRNARNALNHKIPLFERDIFKEELINGNKVRYDILNDQDLIDILSIKTVDAELALANQQNSNSTSSGNTNNNSSNSNQSTNQGGSNTNQQTQGGSSGNPRPHPSNDNIARRIYDFLTTKEVIALSKNKNQAQSVSANIANQKNTPDYYIESQGLYIFKNGETPENLVQNNREKAEQLAIDLGWDLWRTYAERKNKSNLRYKYYLIKNKLTTEKDVLESKIEVDNADLLTVKIQNMYDDCSLFKNKVLNQRMTNQQVRDFLRSENEKKQLNQQSVFKTDIFTSLEGIDQSILSFNNQSELKNYMDTLYPGYNRYPGGGMAVRLSLSGTYGIFNDRAWRVRYRSYHGESIEYMRVPVLFCDMEEQDGIDTYVTSKFKKCGDDYEPVEYEKMCAGANGKWYDANKATYIAALNNL